MRQGDFSHHVRLTVISGYRRRTTRPKTMPKRDGEQQSDRRQEDQYWMRAGQFEGRFWTPTGNAGSEGDITVTTRLGMLRLSEQSVTTTDRCGERHQQARRLRR